VAAKIDPIRETYYQPLERAEQCSTVLFYLTALASIAVVLIEKVNHPGAYEYSQIIFLLLTAATAVLGILLRLYWAPRAQAKRNADFISKAFEVDLTPERTQGYYNSNASDPAKRIALQLLENSFFTKDIARRACWRSRAGSAVYVAIWIGLVVNRSTSIDLVAWVCQVVFGEAVLSSWARLEWLRSRSEAIFQGVYQRARGGLSHSQYFLASSINDLLEYEGAKAISGVTLPSKLFDRHNSRLSQEWETMRRSLEAA
jgi:hypothetical protein